MEPVDKIFTEKFRPRKVSEVVGDFKDKILKYLENPNAIPHFLFYSKHPGTGKTSLAKAIINELGCDALILNSSDDRKIETVREKVKQFALTQSTTPGLKRCVFLDEFDGMLKASQEALRNVMETYSSNVFFILTCNNVNKVIEPIKSRCVGIPFAYPGKEEIAVYLKNICTEEEMRFEDEGITELINKNYPSIRNCVLVLQDLKTEGLEVTLENVTKGNDIYDNIWKLYGEKDWQKIKEIIMASTVDPREVNTYLWRKGLETENLKLIQITCRNERDFAVGCDPKVIFVTSIIELVK